MIEHNWLLAAVVQGGAKSDERQIWIKSHDFPVAIGIGDLDALAFAEGFVSEFDGFRCSAGAAQFARRKDDFATWFGGDSEGAISRFDVHGITIVLDAGRGFHLARHNDECKEEGGRHDLQ